MKHIENLNMKNETTITQTQPKNMNQINYGVRKPASHFLNDAIIIDPITGLPDVKLFQKHLHNQGRLNEYQLKIIFTESTKILKKETTLLRVNVPTTIIGDIHGQFYDLEYVLDRFNLEKDTLLFLGDYVDRGYFSTEVYFILLLMKIRYPDNIFLLRGNHETEKMTRYFTFKNECIFKYNENVYLDCIKSFKNLPLAAVVLSKLYCAHGGFSPSIKYINEIDAIDRFKEPPYKGPFCDILWSDPHPDYENLVLNEFLVNLQRNCSYFYTYPVVSEFLERNNLIGIIRGHEVQDQGFKLYKKFNNFNSIITIFSAPNYCDAYGNKGSFLFFDGEKAHLTKFLEVKHPFYLPNYLDGINWSFPFVSEKASEFLGDLLKHLAEKESESSTRTTTLDEQLEQTEHFTGSMAIMRNERECTSELDDEESSELPCCRLKSSDSDLTYDEAKTQDLENEKIKKVESIDAEGSSIDNSPSCIPEVSRMLNDLDLKSAIKETKIEIDENKDVLKVEVKSKKKKRKDPVICCLQQQ